MLDSAASAVNRWDGWTFQPGHLYYRMAGWNRMGHPTRVKLEELSLAWVADELGL